MAGVPNHNNSAIGSRAHALAIGMRPHSSAEEGLTCSIRRVLTSVAS